MPHADQVNLRVKNLTNDHVKLIVYLNTRKERICQDRSEKWMISLRNSYTAYFNYLIKCSMTLSFRYVRVETLNLSVKSIMGLNA